MKRKRDEEGNEDGEAEEAEEQENQSENEEAEANASLDAEEDGQQQPQSAPVQSQNSKTAAKPKPKKKRKVEVGWSQFTDVDYAAHLKDKAQCGMILKVSLRNFMSHSNFSMAFGPCVNYIGGVNGAGKSAILTAIQLCLGVRTAATSRGSKLSDFIKTGREEGEICLYFFNEGVDAYKTEDYGSVIFVKKKLRLKATSFSMGNAFTNKIVSRKTTDLKEMLEKFNFFIDNPAIVMTQEMSKKLLKDSTATDRYEFFKSGTGLKKIVELLSESLVQIEKFESYLDSKQKGLENSERILQQKRKDYEDSQKIKQLEKESKILFGQYVLTELRGQRIALEQEEANLAALKKQIEDLRTNFSESSLEILKRKKQDIEAKLIAARLEEEQLKERRRAVENQLRELSREKNFADNKERNEMEEIKRIETEIAQKETQKKKTLQAIEKDKQDKETDKLEAKIQNLTKRIEDVNAKKEDTATKIVEKRQLFEEMRGQQEKIERETDEKVGDETRQFAEIKKIEKQIEQTKRVQTDKILYCGEKTHQLLNDIKNHISEFTLPPIGPIGVLLTLKEEMWCSLVEAILKSQVNKFILNAFKDRVPFERCLKRCGINPKNHPVTISAYCDFFYNPPPMNKAFTRISDLFDFDDKIFEKFPDGYYKDKSTETREMIFQNIWNLLVDQASTEQSILVRHSDIATHVMYGDRIREPAASKDPFCQAVLSLNLQEFPPKPVKQAYHQYKSVGHVFTAKKHTQNMSGFQCFPARLFTKNTEKSTKEMENNLKALKAQYENLRKIASEQKKTKQQFMAHLNQLQSEINNMQKFLDSNDRNIEQWQGEIDRTKTILEQTNTYADEYDLIKTIEETIEAKRSDIETKKVALETARSEVRLARERYSEILAQKPEIDQEILNKRGSTDGILGERIEVEKRISKLEEEKRKMQEDIRKRELFYEEKNSKVKQTRSEYQIAYDAAKKNYPDSNETDRPLQELDRTRKQKDEERAALAKRFRTANIAGIEKEYRDRLGKHNSCLSAVQQSKSLLQQFRLSHQVRYQTWKTLREKLALTANHIFETTLSGSQYKGHLAFDHDKSEVAFDINLRGNSVTDTRSLSGGEKSICTVSFVLAMWSVVDSPFKALDEPDVFMDEHNRAYALGHLVLRGKEKRNSQTLIISPVEQDLAVLKNDPPLLICRVIKKIDDNGSSSSSRPNA